MFINIRHCPTRQLHHYTLCRFHGYVAGPRARAYLLAWRRHTLCWAKLLRRLSHKSYPFLRGFYEGRN